MIELAKTDEQAFTSIGALREFLEKRSCRDIDVPCAELSLGKNWALRAGRLEGPLSRTGLRGLLRILAIPEAFGMATCPPDLLALNVARLAKDRAEPVRVRFVDGIITGVMGANRLPLTHELLLRSLDPKQPIQEATLSGASMRITATNGPSEEVLPGDSFVSGWELVNGEDGWLPTEANAFVVRTICTNGMVHVDRRSLFFRSPSSSVPVFESLDALKNALAEDRQPLALASGIQWAAQRHLGDDRNAILAYLGRRFGGQAILPALKDLTVESSFYELLNRVTSLARTHRLETRRRYEAEGGIMLGWFLGQGRKRPPWGRRFCDQCSVMSDDGLKEAVEVKKEIIA